MVTVEQCLWLSAWIGFGALLGTHFFVPMIDLAHMQINLNATSEQLIQDALAACAPAT